MTLRRILPTQGRYKLNKITGMIDCDVIAEDGSVVGRVAMLPHVMLADHAAAAEVIAEWAAWAQVSAEAVNVVPMRKKADGH
jgi:hypothetical protein